MTRNLVLCAVPTVIALLAIYWFRKKKKIKSTDFQYLKSHCLQADEIQPEFSNECSSDFGNTLSDASSFASPVSSEKSLRTSSPLYISPLHDIDGDNHQPNVQTLSDIVDDSCNDDMSFTTKDQYYEFESGPDSILKARKDKETFSDDCSLSNPEDNIAAAKYNHIDSNVSSEFATTQKVNLWETNGLYLLKESESIICENIKPKEIKNFNENITWNNETNKNSENFFNEENSCECDTLPYSHPKECAKIIENDGHSSVFDENSLSYASDDSDGKQLAECKNKGSLSSVLDESLLSSIGDELEKSIDCNSPTAILSKQGNCGNNPLDCSKDVLNLVFEENSQNTEELNISSCATHNRLSSCSSTDNLNEEPLCNTETQNCHETVVTTPTLGPLNVKEENQFSSSNLKIMNDEISCCDSNVQNNFSNLNVKSKQKDISVYNFAALKTFVSTEKQLNEPLANSDATSLESNISNICNYENNKNIFSEENGNLSDSSVNISSHNSLENAHLDAAADVVQRISSDLNLSLKRLLGNATSSSSLAKKEKEIESKPTVSHVVSNDSKSTCYKQSEVSLSNGCEKELETKSSNDLKSSETSSTTVSATTVSRQQSSDSFSWEGTKSLKQSNGTLDVKAPLQSSNEYVYEFELPQDLCGRLIGRNGRHVKSIMERSNANVFIKRHPFDPLLKTVVVEGQRADVNEALEIIRRKYPPSQFPTVTLVQTNIVASTGVPLPESLQLHLPEGASCDVILSSLVSAGHFFLQQPTHPTYPSLSTLDQCMINLYSQMDTPLLPQPIEAGVICAAPVFRGWYRAQVVFVSENASDCGIKFVDYGGFSQVPVSSLRQIRSDFMSLPFQASECYLANVRPMGGENWSPEATSTFEELAQGQILQAMLVEYADDGIPCVYLYRVQGISSTFINKELVERGLAVWVNSNHWDPH